MLSNPKSNLHQMRVLHLKMEPVTKWTRSEQMEQMEHDHSKISVSTQADLLSLNRTILSYKPVGPSEEEVRLKRRIDKIYTERPVSSKYGQQGKGSRQHFHRTVLENIEVRRDIYQGI